MHVHANKRACVCVYVCVHPTGDVWAALSASGHLSQLTKRGARIVEVHTVEDNIMVRPADPLFLGMT